MANGLVLLVLCLPCCILLPGSVYEIDRSFHYQDSWFWLGVIGMILCVAVLECGYRNVRGVLAEALRANPPEQPIPDVAALFRMALLVTTQFVTFMMYLTTMDGGTKFSVFRYVYLVYAAPAALIVVLRWRSWSAPEMVFLRWGWAPVIAFGVPLALPHLLAAGLAKDPLD